VSTFKSSGGTEVTTSDLTDGADLGHSTWTQATVGLSFADGTNAIIAYDPSCAYLDWTNNEGSIYGEGGSTGKSFIPGNTTACVAIVYDINGNQKPNEVGKDIGELNAVLGDDDCIQFGSLCLSKAITPHDAIDTSIDSTWDSNCTNSSSVYCTQNDWAGAKKACADLGMRLPTDVELTAIWKATNKNSGIKDLLKMNAITHWSSSENTTYTVWARYFPIGYRAANYKNNDNAVRCVK
ncbi:MAG: hypothetical protein PHC64_07375, partial [Candidatus Gastranaerophilales bacterium]|nr:hypothetical protein [Candidatus Gastranaerophilales bacterium]